MGVRYYNRITGSFTSPDPIPGANATAYNYPTDPINFDDTSGERPRMRHDGGGIGGSAGGGRRVGGGKVAVRVPLSGKASYARANKAFDVPKQSGVYVVHFKTASMLGAATTCTDALVSIRTAGSLISMAGSQDHLLQEEDIKVAATARERCVLVLARSRWRR